LRFLPLLWIFYLSFIAHPKLSSLFNDFSLLVGDAFGDKLIRQPGENIGTRTIFRAAIYCPIPMKSAKERRLHHY
jgi:hypothetical protein